MVTQVDVLYLEEDPEGEELKARWIELFRKVGVEARVRIVGGFDEVLDAARSGNCDIFICDLALGADPDSRWTGLGLLRQLKEEYPAVLTVGTTGGNPRYRSIDVEGSCFDVFVPKDPLRLNGYSDYVDRIRQRWRIVPNLNVHMAGNIVEPLNGKAPSVRQITNIVRQLFASPPPPQPDRLLPRISLEQLSGGRSASSVFSMRSVERAEARRTIPSILKVSAIEDHEEEMARYERYIKWSLPYTARVDMLGQGRIGDYGGIAYSFAHGGESIDTLTGILQSKDHARAEAAIDRLFDNNKSFWNKLDVGAEPFDLKKRYYDKYFWSEQNTYYHNVEKMYATAAGIGISIKRDRTTIMISGQSYPNPEYVLSRYNAGNIRTSICHGDLNSNNVIVSSGGAVALIDFRDAGIGHVFEDITTLEGCVRLFWGDGTASSIGDPIATFLQMLTIERAIRSRVSHGGTSRSWSLVNHIRQRGLDSFPEEPVSSYYFGLAFYCVRLFRFNLADPWVVVRLLACIVASCETLERGGH